MTTLQSDRYDLIFAGGGFSATLTGEFIKQRLPHLRILIISAPSLPVSQTWSFHLSDISAAALDFLQPTIGAHASAYEVKFPGFIALLRLTMPALSRDLGGRHFLTHGKCDRVSGRVQTIKANALQLDDGSIFSASVVI